MGYLKTNIMDSLDGSTINEAISFLIAQRDDMASKGIDCNDVKLRFDEEPIPYGEGDCVHEMNLYIPTQDEASK